jgi:hypothetical protein
VLLIIATPYALWSVFEDGAGSEVEDVGLSSFLGSAALVSAFDSPGLVSDWLADKRDAFEVEERWSVE